MRRALAFVLLAAVACHGGQPGPATAKAVDTSAPSKEPEEHGTVTRTGNIGTYVSIPWGFSTSSYWIEGPDGLVAIDTQFLPSAAEEMIRTAEAMTKKRFVLAIVLHANPDKFNGTATFQKHGVRVVTSAQVKALMPAIHEKRTRAFYERYEPDYPRELPQPEVFGDRTTDIAAGGLQLRLHVMGPGCSEGHVVVEHTGAGGGAGAGGIFVGDLVASKAHSWLEIGKTDEWLERIDELRRLRPARVFPGRGPAGDATLLDDEEKYLRKVIELVAAEKPTMPVRDDALERAKKGIVAAYPDHDFPVFLQIGLPAEWERQAIRAKKK